jgi:adenosylhomocysteinase
MSCHY